MIKCSGAPQVIRHKIAEMARQIEACIPLARNDAAFWNAVQWGSSADAAADSTEQALMRTPWPDACGCMPADAADPVPGRPRTHC